MPENNKTRIARFKEASFRFLKKRAIKVKGHWRNAKTYVKTKAVRLMEVLKKSFKKGLTWSIRKGQQSINFLKRTARKGAKMFITMFKKLFGTIREDDRNGLYFNVITWTVVCVLGSIIAGFAAAILIKLTVAYAISFTPLSTNPLTWGVAFLLGMALAALIAASGRDDELEVPATKFVAQVLWLGMTLHWYLKSGTYPWLGRALGFSVSKKVAEPFTGPKEKSFLQMGELTFTVWDRADALPGEKGRNLITAIAGNGGNVYTSLSLLLETITPRLILDAVDPALDLGDRARQEFRELTAWFVDSDIPQLGSVIGNVFRGETLITAFINTSIHGFQPGAMVRSKSVLPMFQVVKDGDIDAARKELLMRMNDPVEGADEAMLQNLIHKHANGSVEVRLAEIKLTNPIKEVTDAIGCKMKRTNFANIEVSEEAQVAANKAAAELNERYAQLASADTIKEARKRLMPDPGEIADGTWELTTILAAAQDDKNGNIRIVMVPGSENSLVGAAVAGASQIGDKK